jgi:hypothetical protein
MLMSLLLRKSFRDGFPFPIHILHQGYLGFRPVEVVGGMLCMVVHIPVEIVGEKAYRHDLGGGPS